MEWVLGSLIAFGVVLGILIGFIGMIATPIIAIRLAMITGDLSYLWLLPLTFGFFCLLRWTLELT